MLCFHGKDRVMSCEPSQYNKFLPSPEVLDVMLSGSRAVPPMVVVASGVAPAVAVSGATGPVR